MMSFEDRLDDFHKGLISGDIYSGNKLQTIREKQCKRTEMRLV